MMLLKMKKVPETLADAVAEQEKIRRYLDEAGDFSFLDEVAVEEVAENSAPSFPYGAPGARPYGWFSK